jgi:hypothetical protein
MNRYSTAVGVHAPRRFEYTLSDTNERCLPFLLVSNVRVAEIVPILFFWLIIYAASGPLGLFNSNGNSVNRSVITRSPGLGDR